jgi:hypothetical protein
MRIACWGVCVLFVVGGLVLALESPASAVALRITDPVQGVTVECHDGDPITLLCPTGDLSAAAGVVTYSGEVGTNWTINLTTTFSPFGDAFIDVLSGNTSLGAGTLYVQGSEKDFTQLTGFVLGAGGTFGGTATFDAYADATNTFFGQGTLLGSLGPLGPGPDSGSVNVAGAPSAPYSLTIFTTIIHTKTEGTSFDTDLTPVPEPNVLLLFIIGLTGTGLAVRKRLSYFATP